MALSSPTGCFKCKHIHGQNVTCLEHQKIVVKIYQEANEQLQNRITELEAEVERLEKEVSYYENENQYIKDVVAQNDKLRIALEKIVNVKFNSLSSGLAQSKQIAEQALKNA